MGVILLFQLTQPQANLWTKTTLNFGIPYWSISAGLNILVTSLIVARLYFIRRKTRAVLSSSHSRTYTSIAAMLVESAALYSTVALIFIITYARNSMVQNLMLPLLGQVQAISPLLIMWRVARGQAISRNSLPSSAPSLSQISWRRTQSQGTGTLGTGTTLSAHIPTRFQGQTDSVSLPAYPPSPNVTFASEGKTLDENEGDSVTGWELAERGEHKVPGVEVVIERSVEQWDEDNTHFVRGNAL